MTRSDRTLRSRQSLSAQQGTEAPFPVPGTSQHDLLRFLLLPDAHRARCAWLDWRNRHPIDEVDYGSVRLLPAVYRRLRMLDINDTVLPRLRGIYRKTLVGNMRLRQGARGILEAMCHGGVAVLPLGAYPLLALYYLDWGTRRCDHLDLLVPFAQLDRARRLLGTMRGLRPRSGAPVHRDADDHEIWIGDGLVVHLHWCSVFESGCADDVDGPLRERAWSRDGHALAAPAPSPADILFQSCVHATRAESRSTADHLLDAATVIRHGGEPLDWALVDALAGAAHLRLRLHRVLRFLAAEFDVSVPPGLRGHGDDVYLPVELQEAKWLWHAPGFAGGLPVSWCRYLRRFPDGKAGALRLPGFPGFLYRHWGARSPLHWASLLARRTVRQIRLQVRRPRT